MTFIVEDGSIVTGANAYISVAEFEAHFMDRGLDLSALALIIKQAAIVKATDYADKRFARIFKGRKAQSIQEREWPRMGVWDDSGYWIDTNSIPSNLKRAISEYSFLAYKLVDLLPIPAPGFNQVDSDTGEVVTSAGGPLVREASKVGPVSEDKWYADITKFQMMNRAAAVYSSMVSSMNLPEYPVADEWLKTLVTAGRGTSLERA